MPFTLGQRWISDTESELGLGTVVAVDARTVTLLFPSTGENRLYARSDSPVTRVMFNPGDTITSHDGWQMQVEEVKEENGLLTYIGTRLDTEESGVALREVFLDSKLVFSKPQDRLFAGQIDRMDRFALRYRARKYSSEQFRMPYSGLRGQRTSLIPHQLNIAHDVGRRHAPRVLLADEVGLGKTIEAGMILHQQLLSGAAERVLIIVPETLQHQWLVEMLRRFNLRFALFDDERYADYMVYEGFLPTTQTAADLLAKDDDTFASWIDILQSCNFYPATKTEWADVKQGVIEVEQNALLGDDVQTLLDDLQADIAG